MKSTRQPVEEHETVPNLEACGQNPDYSKVGVVHMTEDLIRRNLIDSKLCIDGSQMDRKIRVIEGFEQSPSNSQAKTTARGGGGKAADRGGRELAGVPPRIQTSALARELRILALPGHLIARMGAVSPLRC
jgi:hypothetical protein